jgi:hypothetical protein
MGLGCVGVARTFHRMMGVLLCEYLEEGALVQVPCCDMLGSDTGLCHEW